MKITVIGDYFLSSGCIREGFERVLGEAVDVRDVQWDITDRTQAQNQNLLVEKEGPEGFACPDYIMDSIADAEMMVTQFCPINSAMIDHCKHLKAIGVLRGGVENVACDHASDRCIQVYNTPGRNANAVADFTVGLLLTETRNVARGSSVIGNGAWADESLAGNRMHDMEGRTLGLIGLGNIGLKVAARMHAFEMEILAYDPFAGEVPDYVRLLPLDEVLKNADYVSMHARLTHATYHIMDEEKIALMKPDAYLFNTARSGLIDEKALADALREGRIKGAGLDVFDREPLPEESPLRSLPNVTLTPHMAGSTAEAFTGAAVLLAHRLKKQWDGQQSCRPVNWKELQQ
ncbi:MAG: 2-hydroxyacid dehydrogenase [Christensenella sp.]|uniref:2-hydroxyacid dehydrogenase n=1 Tax=Christensenella sp. TaxID=1935934 RepID=UPI002B20AF74|nr:2-hydroxyacid dehydrogenase [Christensenella sp.]MEA5004656.1 2-hydroxyacid dehydrogenase [Christensenella sp.]